jgi:hypothetical protein
MGVLRRGASAWNFWTDRLGHPDTAPSPPDHARLRPASWPGRTRRGWWTRRTRRLRRTRWFGRTRRLGRCGARPPGAGRRPRQFQPLRERDGQRLAEWPEQPPRRRRRLDQRHHFRLGHQVLQLAAEAGRLVRHQPDQPGKTSGQTFGWRGFGGRSFGGRGFGGRSFCGQPGCGAAARGFERAGLEFCHQRPEPADQATQPAMNQDQEWPGEVVLGGPRRDRPAQPIEDESEGWPETGWGWDGKHEPFMNLLENFVKENLPVAASSSSSVIASAAKRSRRTATARRRPGLLRRKRSSQ